MAEHSSFVAGLLQLLRAVCLAIILLGWVIACTSSSDKPLHRDQFSPLASIGFSDLDWGSSPPDRESHPTWRTSAYGLSVSLMVQELSPARFASLAGVPAKVYGLFANEELMSVHLFYPLENFRSVSCALNERYAENEGVTRAVERGQLSVTAPEGLSVECAGLVREQFLLARSGGFSWTLADATDGNYALLLHVYVNRPRPNGSPFGIDEVLLEADPRNAQRTHVGITNSRMLQLLSLGSAIGSE